MNSLITLILILAPLFFGFFIKLPKLYLNAIDRLLGLLVNIILLLIGISLARVENLSGQFYMIIGITVLLFVCIIGMNLLVMLWFDYCFPWRVHSSGKKASVSSWGGLRQLLYVVVGFFIGNSMPANWLPSENAGIYCLMLLVLLVGMQLRGSGITLRQVLINRHGVKTAVLIILSSLLGGLLFAALMPEVSWSQGLALASAFGWYSLSGLVMTEAYGPIWGSIALFNDLLRELFALALIPLLMRRCPSTAVGVGGATSLDFVLPVIQASGGLQVVPLAISFGFIVNVAAPFLMAVFSHMRF